MGWVCEGVQGEGERGAERGVVLPRVRYAHPSWSWCWQEDPGYGLQAQPRHLLSLAVSAPLASTGDSCQQSQARVKEASLLRCLHPALGIGLLVSSAHLDACFTFWGPGHWSISISEVNHKARPQGAIQRKPERHRAFGVPGLVCVCHLMVLSLGPVGEPANLRGLCLGPQGLNGPEAPKEGSTVAETGSRATPAFVNCQLFPQAS